MKIIKIIIIGFMILSFFTFSMAYGAPWKTKKLTFTSNASFDPAIGVDGSNIYVVWREGDLNTNIYFKKSMDRGATWQASKNLKYRGSCTGNYESPAIAVDASNIYVVCDDQSKIYLKKSTDGGTTWKATKKLTITQYWTGYPKIAVNGSNIYMVCQGTSSSAVYNNDEIYFKKSTDGGATWQATERLTNALYWAVDPAIAVVGSNIYVVWEECISGGSAIFFKKSTDGGATWQPTKRLTNTTGPTIKPALAANGSNIYVVWLEGSAIFFKKSTDGGATWQATKKLANTIYGGSPSMAVYGSDICVVWEDSTPGNPEIYFIMSKNRGATWQPKMRLTSTSGNTYHPAIAINSSNIYVVCDDGTSGNYEIYLMYTTH